MRPIVRIASWFVLLAPFILLCVDVTTAAENLDAQKKALDIIADFADRICTAIPLEGSENKLELSGDAKAELDELLKRVANLGIEGAVKYQASEWQGVLQQDLAGQLENSRNCKLEVYKELQAKLLPAELSRLYPVWYGTNRQPLDPMDSSRGYTSNHDSHTHYGKCYVSIPESHTFGSIGSKWWQRFLKSTDDRLKISEILQLDENSFWLKIRAELNKLTSDERIILFYIHGYNVSFEDAVLRAAQIGYDLKVSGITALYSWPSKGTLTGYAADSETDNHIEGSSSERYSWVVNAM